MIISKLRSEWAYISGRVAAMSSRPLMLLALKHWGGNDLAATVAVVFLVTVLALYISGFDAHRPFYQCYFGHRPARGTRLSYRTYIASTALQIFMVSPLLVGFMGFRFSDPLLALLVTGYFASERLADESQRFLIFDGQRQEWGARILAKATLQLVGVSAAAMLLHETAAHAAVACLLVGNLAAYGSKLSWRHMPVRRKDWLAALQPCLNLRLFWLLSVTTTVISYIDRLVVMLFQQSDMAVYSILVSSMSIVQNAIEYFFVSFRRRDILQGQLTLQGVLLNRRFYLTLGVGALVGCMTSWGMLRLYHGRQIDHLELIPIVLLSQLALSVTMLMREIIYWNHSVQRLVMLEVGFVVCTLVTAGLIRTYGLSFQVVLGAISVFLTLRMGLMIWGISRAQHSRALIT